MYKFNSIPNLTYKTYEAAKGDFKPNEPFTINVVNNFSLIHHIFINFLFEENSMEHYNNDTL